MNKRELQSYLWLRRNIDQLEERLLELETEATRMTTRMSHQPKGGPSQTMEDLVIKMVEIDEKIRANLADAYELMHQIETAIESLPEKEKCLMRLRYIRGLTFEQIAVEMNYCWQHVHKIHKDALRAIQRYE